MKNPRVLARLKRLLVSRHPNNPILNYPNLVFFSFLCQYKNFYTDLVDIQVLKAVKNLPIRTKHIEQLDKKKNVFLINRPNCLTQSWVTANQYVFKSSLSVKIMTSLRVAGCRTRNQKRVKEIVRSIFLHDVFDGNIFSKNYTKLRLAFKKTEFSIEAVVESKAQSLFPAIY